MLTRTLKMSFWVIYDHMGKLIVANVIWAVAIAFPGTIAGVALFSGDVATVVFIGVPALTVAVGVVLPVGSAGLAHMIKMLIDHKDGSLSDMLGGIRMYWRRASGIGLTSLGLTACLGTSVWFYASALQDRAPLAGYVLSALALWCLVFFGVTALLLMPALVQKKQGTLATLRLAVLLVLDNPLLMIGLAFQVLLLTIVTVPVWPLFFVLYGAAVLVMASCAYELMARRYATLETAKSHGVAADALPAPADEEDDYLNRGLRDVFFPWKG
ncbi:MAG: hypothetical protein IT365_25690 [Candidatus Hydrogenedentes bacterium]|nr:hypothetical protein [Candidatus Hydrogenedentota bacterium]